MAILAWRFLWLEEFYRLTDPEFVKAEIDTYWIARGGQDPAKWIYKVKGRMPVVHFKDFALIGKDAHECEVGSGNLDWKDIIKACKKTKVRWYVVEQDNPFKDRNIFDSLTESYENLRRFGVK